MHLTTYHHLLTNEPLPRSLNRIRQSGLDGMKSKDIRSSRITLTGGVSSHVTTVVSVSYYGPALYSMHPPACYRACNKKKAFKAIVRPSCWIRQCRHTRAVNAIQKLFNATADQDQGISALQLHAPRGLGWVDRRHGTPCNGMVCCKCDFPDVMSMNNRM